jgi:hypothetical protein
MKILNILKIAIKYSSYVAILLETLNFLTDKIENVDTTKKLENDSKN